MKMFYLNTSKVYCLLSVEDVEACGNLRDSNRPRFLGTRMALLRLAWTLILVLAQISPQLSRHKFFIVWSGPNTNLRTYTQANACCS